MLPLPAAAWKGDIGSDQYPGRHIGNTVWEINLGVYFTVMMCDDYAGGTNEYISNADLYLDDVRICNLQLTNRASGDSRDRVMRIIPHSYGDAHPLQTLILGYGDYNIEYYNLPSRSWFTLTKSWYVTLPPENGINTDASGINKNYNYARVVYFPFYEISATETSKSVTAKIKNFQGKDEYSNTVHTFGDKSKAFTISRPFNISSYAVTIDSYGRYVFSAGTNTTVTDAKIFYLGSNSSTPSDAMYSWSGASSSFSYTYNTSSYYKSGGNTRFRARQYFSGDALNRIYVYKDATLPTIATFTGGLTATNQGNGTINLLWKTSNPTSTSNELNKGFRIYKSVNNGAWTECTEGTVPNYSSSNTNYSYTYTIPDSEKEQGVMNYQFKVLRRDLENATSSYFNIQASINAQSDYVMPESPVFDPLSKRIYFKIKEGIRPAGFQFAITKTVADNTSNLNVTPTAVPGNDMYKLQGYVYYFLSGVGDCEATEYTIQTQTGETLRGIPAIITVTHEPAGRRRVSSFAASKGYYNDRVELKWTIPQGYGDFSRFRIYRYPLGSNNKSKIYDQPYDGNLTPAPYPNTGTAAGTFYRYELVGVVSCAGTETETKMAEDFGYSQAFGSVSGKVTFTGTSAGVPDVDIVFENTSTQDNAGKNRALDLKQTDDGYLSVPTPYVDFAEQLSFQMWTKLHRAKTQASDAHQLLKGVTQWQETQSTQDTVPGVGATLRFGKYPTTLLGKVGEYTPGGVSGVDYTMKERLIDNDTASLGQWYYALEPVQWKVVAKTGTRMTLLADHLLDQQPYHSERASTNWNQSLIRMWMNTGVGDGFLAQAFSQNEQDAIATAAVTNTSGGNTNDKAYLPTAAELNTWNVPPSSGDIFTPETVLVPASEEPQSFVTSGNFIVTSTANDGAGSLRQAIANAAEGGRIVIAPALTGQTITLTSQIVFAKSLTIEGNGIIITSSGMTSTTYGTIRINGGIVTLNRIRFYNCQTNDYGGALHCGSATNLTLNSCIFYYNKTISSSAQGGAINTSNGAILKIQGCTFYYNTSGSYGGGAIYNASSSTLTLIGNIFYGNTATGGGYSIYNNGGPITSSYNVWDNNTGTTSFTFSGTGDTQITSYYFSSSDFIPTNANYNILPATLPAGFPTTDFYGRARTGSSAAGAVQPVSKITVTSTANSGAGSLRQAIATVAEGGTIVIDPALTGQTITLTSQIIFAKSLTIEGNGITITNSGMTGTTLGTIRIDGGIVTLNRIRFYNCQTNGYGGALHCGGTATNLTLNSCIFDRNKTTASGSLSGAINNSQATLKIQGCTFYQNTTGSSGGGVIYNYNSGTLTLTGNIFYGNTSTYNRGNTIYNDNGSVTSSYNVWDNNAGSSFTFGGTGDRQIASQTFKTSNYTYVPLTDAVSIVPNSLTDFPTTDFYGAARNGMAGAVQGLEPNRFYWLRNSGDATNKAATARETDGGVNAAGEYVDLNGFIRPVITLDLSKVLFDNVADNRFDVTQGETSAVVTREETKMEVTIDKNNFLNFTLFGETRTWNTDTIPVGAFFHLTGIVMHDGNTWYIKPYINGQALEQKVITNQAAYDPLSFNYAYIGGTGKRHLDGVVDELRIWSNILTETQIASNYKRYIPNNEPGLSGYYRFDEPEGIGNGAYDLSQNVNTSEYNENHGFLVGSAARVSEPDNIPTPAQLALKAVTDANGNYTSGLILPFRNVGSNYTITPMLGVHQFSPGNEIRVISASASTLNGVNFSDNSKFEYNGKVVYQGGNFPVEGCTFLIDGAQQNNSEGNPVTSNAEGNFSLQVPVGTHTIKVVKQGHTFAKDTITRNFQDEELAYMVRFEDITRTRVVGRVVGGTIESGKHLGFGESKNNVGPARIVLQADKDTYKFLNNPKDSVYRHWNTTSSNAVKYNDAEITIRTDEQTGEFYADVYPELFRVMHIYTDTTDYANNRVERDYLENSMQWDLRGKITFSPETQTYLTRERQDSIQPYPDTNPNYWQHFTVNDSIAYNDTLVYTYRVSPTMTVTELDENKQEKFLDEGKTVRYYGEPNFIYYEPYETEGDCVDLVMLHNGAAYYNFSDATNADGYPVYQMNKRYNYLVSLQENYTNWKTGVSEDVPVAGEFIQVKNEMASRASAENFQLDSLGHYIYANQVFQTNTATGLAGIEFDYPCTSATCPNIKITAIVMGGENTGTNFTTQAPDQVLFVLRDPPGANSYAYWEREGTIEMTKQYTIDQEFNLGTMIMVQMGAKQDILMLSGVGVSVGTSTEFEYINDVGGGLYINETYNEEGKKVSTITIKARIETSSDPEWVGPDADVFVGTSMNILYGRTNNIQLGDAVSAGDFETQLFNSRDNAYVIGKNSGISVGEKFSTTFHYTQRLVRETLIPEWKNLIGNLLTDLNPDPGVLTNPVYHSNLPQSDPKFGSLNSNGTTNGNSYTIIYPSAWTENNKLAYTDSVKYFNLQITGWEKTLADNEKAKVNALDRDKFNYSFSDGVSIDYSTLSSAASEIMKSIGGGFTERTEGNVGVETSGLGLQIKVEQDLQFKRMVGSGGSETYSETQGFVLNTPNQDNKFTVDIFDGVGLIPIDESIDDIEGYGEVDGPVWKTLDGITGSFIFITKGGQSSCPYEGADSTRYYQPGTPLNTATMRNEVPLLTVIGQNNVSGVPADAQAVYPIRLVNNSESQVDGWYNLSVNAASNPDGAVVRVDGQVLTENGISVYVPYGPNGVLKTVTIERGPVKYQYPNIELVMSSQCQYDAMDYASDIFSVQQLSASFLQGCSEVTLSQPFDYWVMNTENETANQLPLVVTGFNQNFENLGWVDLQWKDAHSSVWNTIKRYYFKQSVLDNDHTISAENKVLYDGSGQITGLWDMNTRPDASYDVRAVAVCINPTTLLPFINTPSPARSGIKDMLRPEPFGRPQPRDGVLDVEDEILIQFNEPVAAGRILAGNATAEGNIYVTGIKSEAKGSTNHPTAVHLAGNQTLTTQNDVTLAVPFTVEAWVRLNEAGTDGKDHIIFSHGDNLRIGINNNVLFVKANGNSIANTVPDINPADPEWAHIAVTYAANGVVYGYYAIGATTTIFNDNLGAYNQSGRIVIGNAVAGSAGVNADIHDLRIWNAVKKESEISTDMYNLYNGVENNLRYYWRFDEAQGTVATDRAGGLNLQLGNATWTLSHPGKSITIPSGSHLKLPGEKWGFSSAADFSVEFWFKGASGQTNATLFSAGSGDGQDMGSGQTVYDSSDKLSIFFNAQGRIAVASNGNTYAASTSSYLDNQWHHAAFSVNRLSNAVLYVDGNAVVSTPASNIGGMSAIHYYLGQRGYYQGNASMNEDFRLDRPFAGAIDEVRVWNAALDNAFVKDNKNARLNENHTVGLVAYYPFEEYGLQDGSIVENESLSDYSVKNSSDAVLSGNASISSDYAPVKMEGANQDLGFRYVSNGDKILITLTEPRERIERSLITIKVDGVQDLNGNKQASAVIWTALVNQTQLRWGQKELSLETQPAQIVTQSVTITNSGGAPQSWTISGIPTWLNVTPSSGTLAAQQTQTITIKSVASTAVGNYEQTLLLNGESVDQMTVKLNVKNAAPDWSVNPANYEFSASVVATLLIDGIYSNDTDDKLAIFAGNECRGVANVSYESNFGRYIVYLTVYSNDFNVDNFIYRIWDNSAGAERQAITTAVLNWASGYSFGSVNSPVVFEATNVALGDIQLAQGWTWLSLNKSNTDMSVGAIFGEVVNQAYILKSIRPFATPDNGRWDGSLTTVNNTEMYKLKMNVPSVLHTTGTPVTPSATPLSVQPNWNWIGYTAQGVQSVTQAFAGLQPVNGDLVKNQASFAIFNNGNWSGSLTTLIPGGGYVYQSKAATGKTFTYPQVEPSRTTSPLRIANAASATSAFSPVSPNAYSDNMNVIAVVKNGTETLTGVEVGAFVGTECRGAQVSESNGLVFLTIAGETNGSVINFQVQQSNGERIAPAQTLSFVVDALEGSIASPYVIQLQNTGLDKLSASGFGFYPNPVKDRIFINGQTEKIVKLEIVDLSGRVLSVFRRLDDNAIDVSGLASGSYLIRINTESQSVTGKFVKE
jgi:hypothetical protein